MTFLTSPVTPRPLPSPFPTTLSAYWSWPLSRTPHFRAFDFDVGLPLPFPQDFCIINSLPYFRPWLKDQWDLPCTIKKQPLTSLHSCDPHFSSSYIPGTKMEISGFRVILKSLACHYCNRGIFFKVPTWGLKCTWEKTRIMSYRKQCPRGANSRLSAKQCHLHPGMGRGWLWPLEIDSQQVVDGGDWQYMCIFVWVWKCAITSVENGR